MGKTAFLLLLCAACASGPQPAGESASTPRRSEGARLELDRAVASTLRSITARARRGEAATLRAEYAAQVKQQPSDWRPQLFLAWIDQPKDTAWQDIVTLAKIRPDEPWLATASGLIYLQWKSFTEQADAEFTRALESRPGFIPALGGKAEVLRLKGKLSEAKAAYEAILAVEPDFEEAILGHGLTQAALGDPAARETLGRAAKQAPDDPAPLAALARIVLEAKDVPQAIELYGKLIELNPKNREAHLALAKLKSESGDNAGAAAEYETALALSSMDLETTRALAALYRSLGRPEDEAKTLERVAQLDGKDVASLARIAELRKAEGDLAGAEAALRRGVQRAPDDAAILLALANFVAQRSDLIESIEAYRAAWAKGAGEAEGTLQELEAKAGVGKAIVGDPNHVYAEVFSRLNKRFLELKKASPKLGGTLRARVTIGPEGKATLIETLEDTVHEPLLTALVYFALKDAQYLKKSTPTFEFVLNSTRK